MDSFVHYHHEMVYVATSPTKLGFTIKSCPKDGGATFLSDNVRATKEILKTDLGQKLIKKGIC